MVEHTFVVTTAQRGATPHTKFLEGLEQYAKRNNADILILPTNGSRPTSLQTEDEEILHPRITNHYKVIEGDMPLCPNLYIRDFPVQAQQMDPTTSLDRHIAHDQSAIFASPKQRMRVVPNSNTNLPKVLMSTGACTHPNYRDNRRGTIAELDHVYGAITVTVDDATGQYHYRQLRANTKGTFHDLAWRFNGSSKPIKQRVDTLVMGDYHTREISPEVLAATEQMLKELQPKNLVLHDFFDGYSINHHERKNRVLLAQKSGDLDLAQELYDCGRHLAHLRDVAKDTKIIVVKSNHDEFLDRYLREGMFLEDPQNTHISAEILPHFIKGVDPLKKGIELTYGKVPGVRFLSRDDDFKRYGWQLANHGDLGANGARGGHRSLENACSKAIYGHSHTPNIQRQMFHVGTSSHLKLDYTRGPSSWLNTHALIYGHGHPTLINIVGGDWK